jgi:hypothetical protein
VIFDRTMLAYMDEQGEMGLLEPISILFLSKHEKVKTKLQKFIKKFK